MTSWIILTVMISVAAVMAAAPFLRRFDAPRADGSGDIAACLDQMAEVDREAAAGRIDSAQAETARAEIKQRLLADRALAVVGTPWSSGERNSVAVALVTIVVLGSVGFYVLDGNPELPSAPRAAPAEDVSVVEQLAAVTGQPTAAGQLGAAPRPSAAAAWQPIPARGPVASVDQMIGRLATRLKQSPDDAEGWRMLGWSYLRTERFADAATAYAKAVQLAPSVAATRSAWGEALVKVADGVVTPDAKAIFDETLKLEPREPGARYYVGLAKAQSGDRRAALDDWLALIDEADPKELWFADITERTIELAREIGVDVSGRLRRQDIVATDGVGASPARLSIGDVRAALERKPTAEQVGNADSMSAADRQAMIRGMVEALSSRLDRSPRDADGWIKLIRSRTVLGETNAARQAFDRALSVFGDAPEEQRRIETAARQLGLTR